MVKVVWLYEKLSTKYFKFNKTISFKQKKEFINSVEAMCKCLLLEIFKKKHKKVVKRDFLK